MYIKLLHIISFIQIVTATPGTPTTPLVSQLCSGRVSIPSTQLTLLQPGISLILSWSWLFISFHRLCRSLRPELYSLNPQLLCPQQSHSHPLFLYSRDLGLFLSLLKHLPATFIIYDALD